MGKITISADTLPEIMDIVDSLISDAANFAVNGTSGAPPQDPAGSAAAAPAPKATRQSRKKAEAPPPVQPEDKPAAQPNPFNPQPAAQPNPFNPHAGPQPKAHPFNPQPQAPVERPIVTKVKDVLGTMSKNYGEAQVFAWAMQQCLGLSPAITKDEFFNVVIHQQSDEALESLYAKGGGK